MNDVKGHRTTCKAILVDFDGVLRLWPDSDKLIEGEHGLTDGSIREVAFEPGLLNQAIRGCITDHKWRKAIVENLQTSQPNAKAALAIKEWSSGSGEVDTMLLDLLAACKATTEILLLTNATSRLGEDLATLGLENCFTKVLNSSDLGSIKPEPEMFNAAIQACSCAIDEIAFIDDSLVNTMAATDAGLLAHHYVGIDGCRRFLSQIGLPAT